MITDKQIMTIFLDLGLHGFEGFCQRSAPIFQLSLRNGRSVTSISVRNAAAGQNQPRNACIYQILQICRPFFIRPVDICPVRRKQRQTQFVGLGLQLGGRNRIKSGHLDALIAHFCNSFHCIKQDFLLCVCFRCSGGDLFLYGRGHIIAHGIENNADLGALHYFRSLCLLGKCRSG